MLRSAANSSPLRALIGRGEFFLAQLLGVLLIPPQLVAFLECVLACLEPEERVAGELQLGLGLGEDLTGAQQLLARDLLLLLQQFDMGLALGERDRPCYACGRRIQQTATLVCTLLTQCDDVLLYLRAGGAFVGNHAWVRCSRSRIRVASG